MSRKQAKRCQGRHSKLLHKQRVLLLKLRLWQQMKAGRQGRQQWQHRRLLLALQEMWTRSLLT